MPTDPLAKVAAADMALRDHDRERKRIWARRAQAIAEARAAGITLSAIAKVLGVTVERVRQMQNTGAS